MSTYIIAVQRYDTTTFGPDLVWEQGTPLELPEAEARKHLAYLTKLRRSRNLVKLPNGIEFDTYSAHGVPGCPELDGSRTRVTFDF
jgi:hypothetical protein